MATNNTNGEWQFDNEYNDIGFIWFGSTEKTQSLGEFIYQITTHSLDGIA
jgi:hypothetical protein